MKRVLSLLLLIPFLVTQAWAIRGGPFDSPVGNSQAALSGTYGIALQGTEDEGEITNPEALSTTGVVAVSVPTSGLVTGRIIIFDKGLMYIGASQGLLDSRSGSMKLLAQASHYSVISANNSTLAPLVDYILSGQINLSLNIEYFSGLIVASGDALFASYDTLPESVRLTDTTTKNANTVVNANTAVGANTTTNASTAVGANTTTNSNTNTNANTVAQSTQTQNANESATQATTVKRENASTVTEPDGSITTVTTTSASGNTGPDTNSSSSATSNNVQTATNGQTATSGQTATNNQTSLNNQTATNNQISNNGQTSTVSQTSTNNDLNMWHGNTSVPGATLVAGSYTVAVDSTTGLRAGMTVSGEGIPSGATILKVINGTTVQLSKPAISSGSGITLKANPSSVVFLRMTADGIREDSMVGLLPVLAPPSATTHYQIGVGAGGGGGGGLGGGGAGGAGG